MPKLLKDLLQAAGAIATIYTAYVVWESRQSPTSQAGSLVIQPWLLYVAIVAMCASTATTVSAMVARRLDSKTRAIRMLEYHAMHLSWLRWLYSTPSTQESIINDGPRPIHKHRDALLNLTPRVFTQSVVDTFRDPPSYDVASKMAQVEGMSRPEHRALMLAKIDHLATAIRNHWLTLEGQRSPKP